MNNNDQTLTTPDTKTLVDRLSAINRIKGGIADLAIIAAADRLEELERENAALKERVRVLEGPVIGPRPISPYETGDFSGELSGNPG